MDHLALIVLACAAIGAWVHGMRRSPTPFGWKVVAPVGIGVLAVYVIIEAMRSRGMWISGEAQAGWPVIGAMGLAFSVATGVFDEKPKQPRERQAG
jgi:hypothetical protein